MKGLDEQSKKDLKIVGLRVRYYRSIKDMSMEELAAQAGVSEQVIRNLESAKNFTNHGVGMFMRVSRILGVTMGKLFDHGDDI